MGVATPIKYKRHVSHGQVRVAKTTRDDISDRYKPLF